MRTWLRVLAGVGAKARIKGARCLKQPIVHKPRAHLSSAAATDADGKQIRRRYQLQIDGGPVHEWATEGGPIRTTRGIAPVRDREGDGSNRIAQAFARTFLPSGFPTSVACGQAYTQYIKFQSLHHTLEATNGVIASTFLLYAAGLGGSHVPAVSGALNWCLKDALGSAGTLLLAGKAGASFDGRAARRWNVASSCLYSLAVAAEVSTYAFVPGIVFTDASVPLVGWPGTVAFVVIGAAANAAKGAACMAGGSTRAAFHAAFARRNNLGDLTAKASAQTVASYLLGNALGMGLCALAIQQNLWAALAACAALGACHVATAHWSTRCVPIKALDIDSVSWLVHCALARTSGMERAEGGPKEEEEEEPPTPLEAARCDVLWGGPRVRALPIVWRRAGLPLEPARSSGLRRAVVRAVTTRDANEHLVWVEDGRLFLVLQSQASVRGILTAYVEAAFLSIALVPSEPSLRGDAGDRGREGEGEGEAWALARTREMVRPRVDAFVGGLARQGWDVEGAQVNDGFARAAWGCVGGPHPSDSTAL